MVSKTIIVTGAGRGIGLAISKYLLQKSHKVVLVARTQSELEALKKEYPAQVEYLAADLTDFDVRFCANTGFMNVGIDIATTECYKDHRPCREVRRQD